MGKRKRYTAEEKMKILRELQEDGKTISQIAEKYEVHPNCIFKWRKQHLEMGIQGGLSPSRYTKLSSFRHICRV